ncbi:MAG: IS30 family transposase [Minisyncoccota bacterium]
MAHKQLTVQEREEIQKGLWEKESIRSIAKRLGRSHSTVVREINKNLPPQHRVYTPRLANERARKKRESRGRTDRLKNETIRTYVVEHLKMRWSPEQISGRMKLEDIGSISPEAIYQFIYAQLSYGKPRRGKEDLRPYLRRKQKRRQRHGSRKGTRIFKPNGRSIDERPEVVGLRARLGDWEGDTVESKDHAPGVNTLLERKSGLFLVTKVKDKSSEATRATVVSRLQSLPAHTLTTDNGPENRQWQELETALGIDCFFAHPYRSSERGSNENANGLLRDYYPKKTDFREVPNKELAEVEYALNTRPRKRLGFRTPLEVWSGAFQC